MPRHPHLSFFYILKMNNCEFAFPDIISSYAKIRALRCWLVQVHTRLKTVECEKEDDEMLVMRITKLPRGNGSPGQVSLISRITEQKLPGEDKIYFIKSRMTNHYQ